jgi:hypothetical protein
MMASWSMFWSGSELCAGKQTGPTVLENMTGVSSVMMAISFSYIIAMIRLCVNSNNLKVYYYIGASIVMTVEYNFSDPPRHLSVQWNKFIYPHRHSHVRHEY